MKQAHRRHDINDSVWALLEPLLPGQKGQWGGISKDNRLFINAVFWILRTGAPWRDLPPDYGKWGTVYQRFHRWQETGVWEKILETMIDEPDLEWLMIDASHIKVHPRRRVLLAAIKIWARQKGAHFQDTFGRWLVTCVACCSLCILDAHGLPVRMFITAGTTADCKYGEKLIEGFDALALLADRGYDTNAIVEAARSAGMEVVIPPKKNRTEQREYDEYLYKLRHLVENAFLMLKRWRGIATRYAKNTASFLAAVHIRCIAI